MIRIVKARLPLFIILVLAALLRLWSPLSYPPALFSDEVDVALQVKSFLATGRDYYGNFLPLQFRSFSDVRTAVPIYLTAALAKIVPDIERAVRLETSLMGILGIVATYLFAKSLFGKNTGLLAALLLTLTPWHFTYSRAGFETTTLFAFFVFGLYFIKKYFDQKKKLFLWLGIFLLSLTPLIYSTAKLSLFFLPPIILLFPRSSFSKNIKDRNLLAGLVLLFLPLVIVSLSGGIASRFNYISVFTDPTTPTEINVARKLDQGEDLPIGTQPLFLSRAFRNKYVVYGQRISGNLFQLLSAKFLFVAGDPNLRHALPDWGMFYKSEAILILAGLFFLIRRTDKQKHLLLFFIFLIFLSTVPGSLTRDGGTHATRSFLLLLPLVLLAAVGAAALAKYSRYLLFLFLPLFIFESAFYFFDYFHRYIFLSERQWDSGLKQVIVMAKEKTVPVVITDSYDQPLIFYLFYSDYPPERMQALIKKDELLVNAPAETNLGGRKIVDRDVYFGAINNRNLADPLKIKPAAYFLLSSDLPNHGYLFTDKNIVVRLPSGLPIFHEIDTVRPLIPAL